MGQPEAHGHKVSALTTQNWLPMTPPKNAPNVFCNQALAVPNKMQTATSNICHAPMFFSNFFHAPKKGHEFGSKKKGRSKFFTSSPLFKKHKHPVWENYIMLYKFRLLNFGCGFWPTFHNKSGKNAKKLFMTFKHERECLSLPSWLVCTLAFSPPSILWIWTGATVSFFLEFDNKMEKQIRIGIEYDTLD